MTDIDLNQILTFVKVVDSGSFTKAAEQLKQPKSRISRRLAALEKALGTQLIYRTTRQMQLTETGKDYYQRCAPLIQDLENANNAMTSHSVELSGVLRLTAPEDYAKMILAPLLEEFLKKHPKIKIELVLSGAYLDLVKESIDVAIRIGTLKDASMKSKRLSSISSIVVASPGFLEKNPAITKPEHLEQVPCLNFNVGQKNRWRLVKDKQDIRIKANGSVEANSPELLYHFALYGRGASLIPEFLCRDALQSGKLVHILKGWTSGAIPVHLLTPAQKDIPAKTKAFMEFASARL
ncbi:LysR substrate-binding domain-containing protein [Bdellovibrio sp. HCB337]|uniref:LysR family transcriptional regulator n=1 Tax=Bdellovibrio sp. HCB337 TaxID=3394358 RepID=UPI0039A76EB3